MTVEERTREEDAVRIAAVADIHVTDSGGGQWQPIFARIAAEADVLILAGDLTNRGHQKEADVLVTQLGAVRIPILAVLGNHDYESDEGEAIRETLCSAGVHMLDTGPIEVRGVGFAGTKGFAGGFGRSMLEPFGEPLIKQFVYETINESLHLETSLASLTTPRKVAVLHYAPVVATVEGEPEQIFPFLGSSRLEEPLQRFGVRAVVHGHAHRGTLEGQTHSGIPVYNVAYPLLRQRDGDRPYLLLTVS